MNWEMRNGKILVEKIEPKAEVNGILTTLDQCHKSYEATVIAGDHNFKEGMIVLFSEFEGGDVIVDGKKYLILDCEDIWATRPK